MNAMISTALPLPGCLHAPTSNGQLQRRHRFGTFELGSADIERFNRTLERIGAVPATFDCDRLVSAGRVLQRDRIIAGYPVCIRQRMWRVKAAVTMIADRPWRAGETAIATVRLVARYVAANDDLIPDRVPVIGRLDDALVIDAAWTRIADEVVDYLDFRRLRALVVGRDAARSGFDRDDWRQAREDEARLVAQYRRVGASSYCPMPVAMFAVR